jgi:hypothetical protein
MAQVLSSACHCGKSRKSVRCAQRAFSCSQPCGKPLACGTHHCADRKRLQALTPRPGEPCTHARTHCARAQPSGGGQASISAARATDPAPVHARRSSSLRHGRLVALWHSCIQWQLPGSRPHRAHRCHLRAAPAPARPPLPHLRRDQPSRNRRARWLRAPVRAACHAGPCPPCQLTSQRRCECGKRLRTVACDADVVRCDEPCALPLGCGKHQCAKVRAVRPNGGADRASRAHQHATRTRRVFTWRAGVCLPPCLPFDRMPALTKRTHILMRCHSVPACRAGGLGTQARTQ